MIVATDACIVAMGVDTAGRIVERGATVGVVKDHQRGGPVCNVPDYGASEVADHAVAPMRTLARGTHYTGPDSPLTRSATGVGPPAHR